MERPDYTKFLLIPVLVLAFYIAYIPHLNYPYPVHVDEWVHIAYSNSLLAHGHIVHLEPFTGVSSGSIIYDLESGFHILTATIESVTGLSGITIARYFPGLIFILTVLSVFVLAKREGFGWEAAFFTCFIPTNVGLLGPAFFIPIIVNLPLIALSLLLVFYHRSFKSYIMLVFLMGFMFINHVTSAILLVLILVPYFFIHLVKEPKHSIILALIAIVPFLLMLPWTHNLIISTWQSLFTPKPTPAYHDIPYIISFYGYLPIILALIGIVWLSLKGGATGMSLLLGLVVIAVMLATFYSLHYGVEEIYMRGTVIFYLLLGIVAGAGLMAVKRLTLPGHFPAWEPGRNVGYALVGILVIVSLALAIPSRLATPYYHMIDEHDYTTFVWIRSNISPVVGANRRAILDPWKATAFTAITGTQVYARITTAPTPYSNEASQFLADGCPDTLFMLDNRIKIVYTQQEVVNPDLVEVTDGVYILQVNQ